MTPYQDLDRVVRFVRRHLRNDLLSLDEDTELARDLGLDGEDAEEFLVAFQREFGVAIDDFPFDEYFGPEATFSWYDIQVLLGLRKLKILRLRDLVDAIERGRL